MVRREPPRSRSFTTPRWSASEYGEYKNEGHKPFLPRDSLDPVSTSRGASVLSICPLTPPSYGQSRTGSIYCGTLASFPIAGSKGLSPNTPRRSVATRFSGSVWQPHISTVPIGQAERYTGGRSGTSQKYVAYTKPGGSSRRPMRRPSDCTTECDCFQAAGRRIRSGVRFTQYQGSRP